MHKTSDATLSERAGHLYKQLLLLRRVFDGEGGDGSFPFTADDAETRALCGAVRDVLDQLAIHARVLTTVPFPLKEWRPGDSPDDERWRALTEVERREMLSLVAAHENLIGILEREVLQGVEVETHELLRVERARLARFRQEMPFLDRRRIGRE